MDELVENLEKINGEILESIKTIHQDLNARLKNEAGFSCESVLNLTSSIQVMTDVFWTNTLKIQEYKERNKYGYLKN